MQDINVFNNNSMWFNISKISFIYLSNTSIYYSWFSITKITIIIIPCFKDSSISNSFLINLIIDSTFLWFFLKYEKINHFWLILYIKVRTIRTDSPMVSWARFELTTDRLEGDCSIQLSYQDNNYIILYNCSFFKCF